MTENDGAENTIRLERRFAHPPAAVWAALTTPELLARWWAPGDIAPAVGHRFTMDMAEWGQQKCEVLAVEPGVSIRFSFAEGTLDTTITWSLEAVDGGTLLTLEHAGFRLDTPLGARAIEGMGNGWPGVLSRIDRVLAEADQA
ncbi:SRPBCC domain-containing protein [Sinomonas flava]|uniref:SRPBCC domain-containing protein n=1 Tax=Sinomonas flava TaxID=496857 RepID=A0ABN3C0N6_9MICC